MASSSATFRAANMAKKRPTCRRRAFYQRRFFRFLQCALGRRVRGSHHGGDLRLQNPGDDPRASNSHGGTQGVRFQARKTHHLHDRKSRRRPVFPESPRNITQAWDPEGKPRATKSRSSPIAITSLGGGSGSPSRQPVRSRARFEFQKPLLEAFNDKPVLNIPWGSFYVLKIVNRLKTERDYLDKVRPIRLFILLGLVSDPWFTIRYMFLTSYYFLKTRFIYSTKRRSWIKVTAKIIKEQPEPVSGSGIRSTGAFEQKADVKTVIFGHTHKPMNRIWPDGKQYINTGTWTKMINLDFRNLGRQICADLRARENRGRRCHVRAQAMAGRIRPSSALPLALAASQNFDCLRAEMGSFSSCDGREYSLQSKREIGRNGIRLMLSP